MAAIMKAFTAAGLAYLLVAAPVAHADIEQPHRHYWQGWGDHLIDQDPRRIIDTINQLSAVNPAW